MLILARLLLGIGIPLYLFIPIASPPGWFEHDAPRIPLALIGGGLAAAGALLVRFRRPGGGIGAAGAAALVFAVLQGLSVLSAENRREAFDPVAVTTAGIGFFMALRLLPEPARSGARRRILAALPLLGGGLAAYGLAQHLGLDPISPGRPAPPVGTLGNLNLVCAVLGPLFVLTVLRLSAVRGRRQVLLHAAAAVLLLACLGVTGQRGWVPVVAAGLLLAWCCSPGHAADLHPPPSTGLRPVRLGLAAGAVVLLAMCGIRFANLGFSSDRYGVWSETLGMVRDHPLRGVGPGNFVIQFPPYHEGLWYRVKDGFESVDFETFPDPHNGWLQVATESGIPAAAVLAVLAVLAIRGSFRAARSGAAEEARIDGRALAGFLGAGAVAGLLYPFAESGLVASQFWIGLALASGVVGGGERGRVGASTAPDPRTPARSHAPTGGAVNVPILSLSFVGALILLPIAIRHFRANHAFNHALSDIRNGRESEALAGLARAETFDPANWKIHFHGGRIADAAKQEVEALRHAEAAVEGAPRDVVLRLTRGLLRLQQGNRKGAGDDFAEVRRIAPKFFLSPFQLGRVRLGDGEAVAAAELFADAIRLEPRFGKGFAFLGMAEAMAGRKERAAEAFARLREALPRLALAELIAVEAETSPAVRKASEAGVFADSGVGGATPGQPGIRDDQGGVK